MVSVSNQPVWSEGATRRARPGLVGSQVADVVIVGAGYSGLWLAYWILDRDPNLSVAVLERHHVGHGASGRNGGWASALLPTSLQSLSRSIGEAATVRLQKEMLSAVTEIGSISETEGIDCHYRLGGTISLVVNEHQRRRAVEDLDDYQRFGFGSRALLLDRTATRNRIAFDGESVFRPDCAVVHPRRLVDGLALAVERRGARIFENTTVTEVGRGEVTTEGGCVRAPFVIDCREAYAARTSRRRVIPIHSSMIATEPLDEATWQQIGLADRETFTDHRRQLVYGQRTADGRLAFGGRGVGYRFGSRIDPTSESIRRVHDDLRHSLIELFPILDDVLITHRWGGPLAAPRDWTWTVSLDRDTGIGLTGGYTGDGVTSAFVAGRAMADAVVLERSDFPLFGHRSPRWEPEPLRWLGVNTMSRLAGRLDRREASGRSTRLLRLAYDRLIG